MSDLLLKATNIHKSYLMGTEPLRVLMGTSLFVKRGEFLTVMGASGCGKSTLLHILGTLDTPDEGAVVFDGLDVFALPTSRREDLRCRRIGFVFQFYHLLSELSVFENVLLPRMVAHSMWRWPRLNREATDAVGEVLTGVGLGHRTTHRPNQLSGGERQRAAIARALVNRPSLLLADEPTGNLDRKTGQGILDLLRRLNSQGQTIVMVTHDAQIAACADRRVTLVEGQVQER